MSYYKKNLELFQSKSSMLYETILNEKPIFDVNIEIVKEHPNYIVTRDDKKCFIHSIFDVNEEMNQMFKKVDKSATTLIIFGIGFGHALSYIRDKLKNIKNILIVEPSIEIFKSFMTNYDISKEMNNYSNITFIVNKDIDCLLTLLFGYIRDKIAKNINIVYNISYRTIFSEYYDAISEALSDMISKTAINLVTNTHFRKQWTYNPVKNLRHSAVNIDEVFNKFEGKSAIIVSAGPSLNKNIQLLKYAKDKALIASVGTASKILESNNIKPHLRFAMDSQEGEKVIFENLKEDNSILVFSDRVYHEVVPIFKRRLRMILDLDYVSRYIYKKADIKFQTIKSGFSIANTALDALIKLGFKNIIFLGQDMCYTEDKLYADGSWLQGYKLDVNDGTKRYIKMKDINGNEVYTYEAFLGIKKIFESIISDNSELNYINATEGGIGIKGTKIKTFKQVLNEELLEEYNYDDFFEKLFKVNNRNENYEKINNTLMMLKRDIDEMIKVNELRIRGLKKIDRYLNKGLGLSKIERETIYLNKYEEDLRKIDSYNNFIKLVMDDVYKVILNKFKYDGEDPKEAILNSKKVLECISCELKVYLLYVKACIKENFES